MESCVATTLFLSRNAPTCLCCSSAEDCRITLSLSASSADSTSVNWSRNAAFTRSSSSKSCVFSLRSFEICSFQPTSRLPKRSRSRATASATRRSVSRNWSVLFTAVASGEGTRGRGRCCSLGGAPLSGVPPRGGEVLGGTTPAPRLDARPAEPAVRRTELRAKEFGRPGREEREEGRLDMMLFNVEQSTYCHHNITNNGLIRGKNYRGRRTHDLQRHCVVIYAMPAQHHVAGRRNRDQPNAVASR